MWTMIPFVFMFVTTIAALLYKAYEAFFINLPKTADPVANKIASVGEYTAAQVIIGSVCVILVIAAFDPGLGWHYSAAQVRRPARQGRGQDVVDSQG